MIETILDEMEKVDDLISREATINALLGITAIQNTIPLVSAIFSIKKLPSAQPEIIRCKDCVYWDFLGYCVDFMTQEENGFCSWAERRNDGKAY